MKVAVEKTKLDTLATAIGIKSQTAVPQTIDELTDTVMNMSEGGITPTGSISITQNGQTDVTRYATADVSVTPTLQTVTKSYTPTDSQQTETITPSTGYDGLDQVDVTVNATQSADYLMLVGRDAEYYTDPVTGYSFRERTMLKVYSAGWIGAGEEYSNYSTHAAIPSNTYITPTTSAQTVGGANYMMRGAITVSGDANLVAGNIKNGTTIFGVTGTYSGGSSPVKTATGTFTGNGTRTIDVTCDFEPDLVYFTSDPGTTASSGTVAAIIARDMMAATRYRNNSTTNSHYAVTPCVNLNTSGSSYSWRATYASGTVTLYCFSNNARTLLTNGRTYTYKFVKWTT